MTSLFGRMLKFFDGPRRIEDFFTEIVVSLFERRPDICLGWLENVGAISSRKNDKVRRIIQISSQKPFGRDRLDIFMEIVSLSRSGDAEPRTEIVAIESKLGAREGEGQLPKYAIHLKKMSGDRKTLIYITRDYDPKDELEVLTEIQDVSFQQRRWHDLYWFLQKSERDALIEEVMQFMEEQRMSRSNRLSATDLIALSGLQRAIQLLDDTIDEKVIDELGSFMRNKVRSKQNAFKTQIRQDDGYFIYADIGGAEQLGCYLGYYFNGPEDYPVASVGLWIDSEASTDLKLSELIRSISAHEGWFTYSPNDTLAGTEVWNELNLASVVGEEDHIFAIKRFFIDSIHQLRDELTEFKKVNPDLPWNGGN